MEESSTNDLKFLQEQLAEKSISHLDSETELDELKERTGLVSPDQPPKIVEKDVEIGVSMVNQPPKVGLSQKADKILPEKLPKKKITKTTIATAAGKVLSKLIAVPKFIAKLKVKKPFLKLAKKKALLGGAVSLLGKKAIGVGAGLSFLGAKTAAAGAALKTLPLKAIHNGIIPGVKGLVTKAASYIPASPALGALSSLDLVNSELASIRGISLMSRVFLNWLNSRSDSEIVIVEDNENELINEETPMVEIGNDPIGNDYFKYETNDEFSTINVVKRNKRAVEQPTLDLNIALRLLKMAEIEDCIGRVICELGCDVKKYGDEGLIVFRNLLDLQMSGQVKSKDFDFYRTALLKGRKMSHKKECQNCRNHYPKCKALTKDLLAVASLVKLE